MSKLLQELKRRKVFRVSAVYAVAAWVLIQIADVVLPTFGAPTWVNQTFIFLLVLGFIPTLIAAWAYERTPDGIKPDYEVQASPERTVTAVQPINYVILLIVLLVAGFQITDQYLQEPPQMPSSGTLPAVVSAGVMRSYIDLDHPNSRSPFAANRTEFVLSRDGSLLAYGIENGLALSTQSYVRNLATQNIASLTGVFISPAISPNGEQIAGVLQNRLLIHSVNSGIVREMPLLYRDSVTTWVSDSEILYSNLEDRGIHRKSLISDDDESLTLPLEGTSFHMDPITLPATDAFLYVNVNASVSNDSDISLYNPVEGTSESLIFGGYQPRYASSGHIVFLRSGDLWAVPFDIDGLQITGQEVRVIEGVESFPLNYFANYTFSNNGRLLYLSGEQRMPLSSGFNWIDRLGNKEDIPLPMGSYTDPELSPDNSTLAVTVAQSGGSDIWVFDLRQETFSRRTFSGNAKGAKWSPDSRKLAYQSIGEGIWQINADGSGQAEQLTAEVNTRPDSFAGSGESLFYLVGEVGFANIKRLDYRDGAWIAVPIIESESIYFGAALSPDGSWLAYASNENGPTSIYVRPYPDVENGKWQITTENSTEPKWSADGKELYYRRGIEVMGVEIDTQNGFSAGSPQTLATGFRAPPRDPPAYAVSNDGGRFIQFSSGEMYDVGEGEVADSIRLTVVENWFEELKQLAPSTAQ